MKKPTVRNVLLTSFIIMAALSLFIGAVGIFSINEINKRDREMYDYAPTINYLGTVTKYFQKINADLYQLVIHSRYEEYDEIAVINGNIDFYNSKIQAGMEEYIKTAFDETTEINFYTAKAMYESEYLPFVKNAQTVLQNTGDLKAALGIILDGSGIYEKIEALLNSSVEDNIGWHYDEVRVNERISRYALYLQTSAISVSLLIALFFAFYLSRKTGKMSETIAEQAEHIRNENERIKVLLDTSPMACRLFNKDYQIFECNEASIKLFQLSDKQEFMAKYYNFSPEYQPDGQSSMDRAKFVLDKAFAGEQFVFEWQHQLPDGTPLPCEVTLKRARYGNEYVVAGYTRDLREHKRMMEDIEKRDDLLNVINRVAAVLLAASDIENFESSLIESMELIGRCLEADCVCIWPNEMIGGALNFVLRYKWLSNVGAEASPSEIGTAVPYGDHMLQLFLSGECVNGPINELPDEDRELLEILGLASTVSIPLFYHDKFWGLFCVDDCVRERYFTEGEIGILRSAGLMLVNAINRGKQAAEIREAHKRARLLLDATPLAVNFWDGDLNLFDCNEEAVRLFNVKDKKDYADRFYELSSEYQPDGSLSRELAPICLRKAFEEGAYTREWLHRSSDGVLIPAELTFVRLEYADGYAVAVYVRDLREQKKMMLDICESAEKLEEAFKDIQKANNAKSDFLASMSHEMRTPLNAIIGLSGLSLENERLDGETRSYLEKVNDSGEMLLSIVNDILDISKIESGKMILVDVDYDVPSLINDTVTQNILRIGEKPIKFYLDIAEDMFSRLNGDELRIKQIMNNLLSNAIKYTEEGSVELGVACARKNDYVWVTIKVSDTGCGIRGEDMDNLFKDYAKLDLVSNREIEGTGLGLPIAKNLAEMMGGSVDVESEYGRGSVFTVRIVQKFVSDIRIDRRVVQSLQNFRYSDEKRGRNAMLKRLSLPYARVLVVDDNITNLEVAKGLMKPYGMQIDCVTGGRQAVDAVKNEQVKYNAVFMDHMMPGMDGIEATRVIREEIGTEYARNIPIIALTANAIAGNEAMFLSKGFQAFISKPVEIARLDEVIRNFVRDKEQEELYSEQTGIAFTPDGQIKRAVSERRSGIDRRVSGMGIKGLNIEKSVERFNGDRDVYFNVLRAFVKNTPQLIDSIDHTGPDGLNEYAVTMHGIKGSCRGVGADAVADTAERLELAAKAGDTGFITDFTPFLTSSIRQLISDIEKMMEAEYPDGPKPQKDRPDAGVLRKLLDASGKYDAEEVDALTTELDSYSYVSDSELVAGLLKYAGQYNFKEIKEKLTAFFGQREV